MIYLSTNSRSLHCSYLSSVNRSMTCVIALALGINFGIPPFLGFWVEVCLYFCLCSSFYLGIFAILLVSFFSLLFCYCLYLPVFSSSTSTRASTNFNPVGYIPGLSFSLLVVLCSSLFAL